MGKKLQADWHAMRASYVCNNVGFQTLAEQYDVSYAAVRKRASREGWNDQREKFKGTLAEQVTERVTAAIVGAEAERRLKIIAAGDLLLEKLTRAINEMGEFYTVKRQDVDIKVVEGKKYPVGTTATQAMRGEAVVDTGAIRNLAAALKSLRETAKVAPEEITDNTGVAIAFEGDTEEASG